MAKLNPFIEEHIEDSIKELFGSKKKSSKLELDEIRECFDANEASVEDIAKAVGNMIRGAEKEDTKLRACDMALKVHGIFKDMDEKQVPHITINVAGEGNMINLLCP